jgi:hypothetical protein
VDLAIHLEQSISHRLGADRQVRVGGDLAVRRNVDLAIHLEQQGGPYHSERPDRPTLKANRGKE